MRVDELGSTRINVALVSIKVSILELSALCAKYGNEFKGTYPTNKYSI